MLLLGAYEDVTRIAPYVDVDGGGKRPISKLLLLASESR